MHVLDNYKEKKRYWKFKDEALDRVLLDNLFWKMI